MNSRIDNNSNLKPPGAEGERRLGGATLLVSILSLFILFVERVEGISMTISMTLTTLTA